MWLSSEAIAAWTPGRSGRRGGQRRYSDLAIETALTLRLIYHLPLSQAEGFLHALFGMMRLDLSAPDYTTLSRRSQHLTRRLRRVPPALVHGSRPLGEPRSTSWPSWRQQVHDLDMKSSVHPKYKTKYHVGNWPAYDRALVQRSDITVWLAPDAIATWEAVGVGKRGGQLQYSDLAIETALTLLRRRQFLSGERCLTPPSRQSAFG